MSGMRDFLKRLDAQPVPMQDGRRVTELTEGWASTRHRRRRCTTRARGAPSPTRCAQVVRKGDGTG